MWNTILLVVYVAALYFLYEVWTGGQERDRKILWTLVLLLLPAIGVVLYLLMGRKK